MTDQQQNWSPVSHSGGGSFLKTGNYFKHFTVFESMQFCLSLHKSIKVSLICPCLFQGGQLFPSFPACNAHSKTGRWEVCPVLSSGGVVRKPILEKDEKSIGGKETREEVSPKRGSDNFNKPGSAFPLKCGYLSKIIEGEHQISSQARKQHTFQEKNPLFCVEFF